MAAGRGGAGGGAAIGHPAVESCVYRGQGDVIPGSVGGGAAARGLCLDAGGGEQVVALGSRSIMQTGGVSLSLFPSPSPHLLHTVLSHSFPSWVFFLHLFITDYFE